MPRIRFVQGYDDAAVWARLRSRLWPEADAAELLAETQAFVNGAKMPTIACAFLAEESDGVEGFIELSIRAFDDSCESRPVPYVEGWYVEPSARNRGIGRALMKRAEIWAEDLGFTEIASDTEIYNDVSLAAHAHCGFEETERLVKLRKHLASTWRR
jgi:aminoglycoside 6'-N-acetyltransferase I